MSRHPEVKWAQRLDKVYLAVLLADAKNVKINLEPDGVFTFSGVAGSDNNLYELKLELNDKVNVETSKLNTGVRSIVCVIEKAEKGWWKKLLRGDEKIPHYIKVDWDKWVDEDDDDGWSYASFLLLDMVISPNDLNLGGMDFSNFDSMGGMDDGDDLDDSDDEDTEASKPEHAGEAGGDDNAPAATKQTETATKETETSPST
ncbi:Uncharacterized protein AXF42_Ash007409 [Apostasia shenzhenica]|uniref:Co-chaperone protein p23 n=1 Tax=Apostasia shenzhenica TaxID=1088818 RepID=A0A2I0BA31_9ASPA|nr:Uncharacterized protein AXF42_Ash007409 [Apostasia shenzhenica]